MTETGTVSSRARRVYETDHGSFSPEQLPPELAAKLDAAMFRKDGYIDRRHTRTRQAWAELENWALTQFNGQDTESKVHG